ncbi:MAG: hypothetical protein CMM94_03370 [Rickettsiales bacterium]|nr:hypothetical protein [Rickettsiales bacterium]
MRLFLLLICTVLLGIPPAWAGSYHLDIAREKVNITGNPLPWHMDMLWSTEDQAIFAGIISFYFGQRAMCKVRSGK